MDGNRQIALNELRRVGQLFQGGGYHCDDSTIDGYAPGAGAITCSAHSSDYELQDWNIDLREMLRFVQLYNSDSYEVCLEGEDGFCS